MFVVFAYDIRDSRRRLRVARTLIRVATRAQRSVFEGHLDRATLRATVAKLRKILDVRADSLRIYVLCSRCVEQCVALGCGELTRQPQTFVL